MQQNYIAIYYKKRTKITKSEVFKMLFLFLKISILLIINML
jgi:hypothetical protein